MEQALQEHYGRGEEKDRLERPIGTVEFARTREILLRHLPGPPSAVADVGGGPGRYALWLAKRGHQVVHRDLVRLHVDQLLEVAGPPAALDTGVADARHLDLPDECVDAVLLLYHLTERADRLVALREATRIVRPGGPVFVAAISRWAPRLDGVLRERLYETWPGIMATADQVERTGRLPPLAKGSFAGYCHRPRQLRAEIISAGLELVDLVAVEGPAGLFNDLGERLASDAARNVLLDSVRALERVPELLGVSGHLLATARRRVS